MNNGTEDHLDKWCCRSSRLLGLRPSVDKKYECGQKIMSVDQIFECVVCECECALLSTVECDSAISGDRPIIRSPRDVERWKSILSVRKKQTTNIIPRERGEMEILSIC